MAFTAPVALVTGAARRIGAAIARRLHADGHALALHYRRPGPELDALLAAFEAARPGSAVALQADLREPQACERLVAEAQARLGRLDALVNNASAFAVAPLEASDAALFDAQFAVNARAPFLLARAAAPFLRAQRGAIVNVADVYAAQPRPDAIAYSASKAALVAITQGLAGALAPEVRVNAVAPGAILWPDGESGSGDREAILARTALGRRGSPEDIADAVAWLLRAPFVTGQVVRVDGGRALTA
ncbi:pteridine reductase [Coralloluteibacterium thermophilus]|uniref:Pteridine reductase n=1 Tax=Coralloluteibacterium thermophilum TaxID=2707049 RepID=A0ABV9NME7_9GAMM